MHRRLRFALSQNGCGRENFFFSILNGSRRTCNSLAGLRSHEISICISLVAPCNYRAALQMIEVERDCSLTMANQVRPSDLIPTIFVRRSAFDVRCFTCSSTEAACPAARILHSDGPVRVALPLRFHLPSRRGSSV